MKIPYKVDSSGEGLEKQEVCETPCPVGMTLGRESVMVASTYCTDCCEFFIKGTKTHIECSFGENKKEDTKDFNKEA